MNKVLSIGWKDLIVIFRDRAALILMLAAPFVLTLGMGFVTGRFSGTSSAGLSDIPVVIVNQDEGDLGAFLTEIFGSEELAELLEPTTAVDAVSARQQVNDDKVAAVVIIPAGFSASILPNTESGTTGAPVSIEVHANPARPISAGVVQSIVDGFVNQLEIGLIGGQVAVTQLIPNGLVSVQDAPQAGQEIGARLAAQQGNTRLITLRGTDAAAANDRAEFNILAFWAPGMAILFLMYTVSLGGRSILTERREGTLPRMLTTPTSYAQVLGGKVLGIFLSGVAQMSILIVASSLLFNLRWGDPLAVLVLVLAVVAGVTGWGILLAAIAKTPAQVSSVGTALMLLFAVLGGPFRSPASSFPGWLQILSKLTPNAWGLEGFTELGSGGTLTDVLTPIGALLLMAAVLFSIAAAVFRRQAVAQR